MISIIVVIGKNNAIGCNNQLLWDIPGDMARFRTLTMGHPIVMGRKTFESIGRVLPGRTNIIISRNANYQHDACLTTSSLETAIETAKQKPGADEIFIIGGAQIFELALPYTDKIYLTIVDDSPVADSFFPNYQEFGKILKEETHETDQLKYTFLEISKK